MYGEQSVVAAGSEQLPLPEQLAVWMNEAPEQEAVAQVTAFDCC